MDLNCSSTDTLNYTYRARDTHAYAATVHEQHYSMDRNLSSMLACVVNANEFSRNRMYFENHPSELGGLRTCMWRCRTRRNGGQWKPSLASSGLAPRSDSTCRAISPIRSTRGMCSRANTPGSLQVGEKACDSQII